MEIGEADALHRECFTALLHKIRSPCFPIKHSDRFRLEPFGGRSTPARIDRQQSGWESPWALLPPKRSSGFPFKIPTFKPTSTISPSVSPQESVMKNPPITRNAVYDLIAENAVWNRGPNTGTENGHTWLYRPSNTITRRVGPNRNVLELMRNEFLELYGITNAPSVMPEQNATADECVSIVGNFFAAICLLRPRSSPRATQ